MEFRCFHSLVAVLFFILSVQGQLPLWTKINDVKENGFFTDFNLTSPLQNLPNPDYHRFEERQEDFEPQEACTHHYTNLTTGSSGVITSPNYPGNYPAGLRCQWNLQSEPGTVIRVTFFDVVTQPVFLVFPDYVAVSLSGKWDNFYRFAGDMNRISPISLESRQNQLGLRFASGFDLFNFRGFKMAYVVTNRFVSDEGNSTPSLDYGNGTEVSALCDYQPIHLPLDSVGEIPSKKIIGGFEVTPHEYPFMVAMIMDDDTFCSGSLIDELHVLTAAHCTIGKKKIELYFGVHDMKLEEAESRQYQVITSDNVIVHPQYNPVTLANDITIVKLNRKVRITPFVQPVYLPSVYSMGNNFVGWNLTTMGWGETNETQAAAGESRVNPILHKASSGVISNEECRKTFQSKVTGNVLCTRAFMDLVGPCFGDSGSPLVARFTRSPSTADDASPVVNDDNQINQCYYTKGKKNQSSQKASTQLKSNDWFVQLGILSFGSLKCGDGHPVAYTRVTAYLDFITSVISPNESRVY